MFAGTPLGSTIAYFMHVRLRQSVLWNVYSVACILEGLWHKGIGFVGGFCTRVYSSLLWVPFCGTCILSRASWRVCSTRALGSWAVSARGSIRACYGCLFVERVFCRVHLGGFVAQGHWVRGRFLHEGLFEPAMGAFLWLYARQGFYESLCSKLLLRTRSVSLMDLPNLT